MSARIKATTAGITIAARAAVLGSRGARLAADARAGSVRGVSIADDLTPETSLVGRHGHHHEAARETAEPLCRTLLLTGSLASRSTTSKFG